MVKCNIPQPAQPIQPPKGSKLKSRILSLYNGIADVAGVVTTRQQLEADLSSEFAVIAASAAELPNLTRYNWLENKLASWFGVRSWLWQAGDLGRTTAGKVSDALLQKGREASQFISYLALNKAIPDIRRLYSELQTSLPNVDIQDLQEILHDHIVIGQFPKLQNVYDSPVVRAQLAERYLKHTERLTGMGVDAEAIKKLDELSGVISGHLDGVRILVGRYGLDIKQLQNGGYFPLQLTDEARKVVEAASETAFSSKSKAVRDAAGVLNDSRKSLIPVVLDLPELAKELKISEFDLALASVQPGAVSKLLENKTAKEMESLLNRGLLTQVPAMSDELKVFFAEGLDLPIAGLGEAIVLDPVKAILKYDEQLKGAAENAAMVQVALQEGVQRGWVMDDITFRQLPVELQKDFVKTGSDSLLQELISSGNLRDEIADSWMHRTVAEQLKANFVVNTSYEQLGILGSVSQKLLGIVGNFKRGALLAASVPGLGYVKRVGTQNLVSLQAAGGVGAVFKYPEAMTDFVRVTSQHSLESLSNKKTYEIGGKLFSERELFFTTFVRAGLDYSTVAGERVNKQSWGKLRDILSKDGLERFWKFSELYAERYGSPATGKILNAAELAKEVGSKAFRGLYEELAWANQIADFSARWAAIKHLAANPGDAKVFGNRGWKDLDELVRYTNEYWGINENVGTVGKFAGQFLIPFAQFALVAPGSMMRHAIRHPERYTRMMLLYSQAQAALGGELTDAELTDNQKDRYTMFFGRSPSGKLWGVDPGTVDFYLSSKEWITQNFQAALRTGGVEVGSRKEIEESKVDRFSDVWRGLRETFDKAYLTRGAGILFQGRNPNTGENFEPGAEDTLLNVRMPERVRAFLVDSVPVLRTLDANLPAGLVGSAGGFNYTTGEYREPQAGVFGNVPSRGGNRGKQSPNLFSASDAAAWVLSTGGGLTLSEVDPAGNVIRNYNDFGKLIDDINTALAQVDEAVNLDVEQKRPDLGYLQERRVRLLQIKGSLQYQQLLMRKLSREKGYPDPTAIQKLRSLVRGVNDTDNEALIEFIKTQR